MSAYDVYKLVEDVVNEIQFKERVRYCYCMKQIRAAFLIGDFRKADELIQMLYFLK